MLKEKGETGAIHQETVCKLQVSEKNNEGLRVR